MRVRKSSFLSACADTLVTFENQMVNEYWSRAYSPRSPFPITRHVFGPLAPCKRPSRQPHHFRRSLKKQDFHAHRFQNQRLRDRFSRKRTTERRHRELEFVLALRQIENEQQLLPAARSN